MKILIFGALRFGNITFCIEYNVRILILGVLIKSTVCYKKFLEKKKSLETLFLIFQFGNRSM
jgi:hypothetical protein